MIKKMKTGTYFKGKEFFDFDFYTDLRVSEKLKFVNSVVDLLVDEKQYNSVIRDLIFDYFTIKIFTEIDMSNFENSNSFLNDVEDFLEETNIVDIVKENASPMLFDELNKAIDDSIEYLTGIHKNSFDDALVSLINTFENKINEVDLKNMMEMASKFNEITDEFTPENIVKAYIKTDAHKKNLKEIKESKKKKSKSSSEDKK